jgi:xanthine dehydrogenase accessory factor
MTETCSPVAVRRTVSFCEAVIDAQQIVEGVMARRAASLAEVAQINRSGDIAVIVDPACKVVDEFAPDVLIDGIMAKKNLGTRKELADLVIALGPGFVAGKDAHYIVETHRGHDLGKLISQGSAAANTGVPGNICGHTSERALRAPGDGMVVSGLQIGNPVVGGDLIATVDGREARSMLSGVLRGLIRPGTIVNKGLKIGDVDPRGEPAYCRTISEKARAVGGAVLEAILKERNN